MNMKTTCLAAAALALLAGACVPQTFTMNLEMRHPSLSGMDLGGKTISVAYVDGKDSLFSKNLAAGFAEAIENDYFGGRQFVNIYRMAPSPGADYSSRDTLLNLIMDSGDDVVFLFDEPVFGEPVFGRQIPAANTVADSAYVVPVRLPYDLRLYAYDALNRADTVRIFAGTSSIRQNIYTSADPDSEDLTARLWDDTAAVAAHAEEAGSRSAEKFKAVWKGESYSFYYYDSGEWTAAAEDAYAFRWQEAMRRWMMLAEKSSGEQRAHAEYDMAAACYILGDFELASKWLDLSDKDGKTELSDGLRKRILERTMAF